MNRAIACGLVINELLTNSIKHAFSGETRGRVSVSFKTEGDDYLLRVEDDGVGLPEDLNIENSSGLGFKVVESLIQQLGGRLEISRENGTAFSIIFAQ